MSVAGRKLYALWCEGFIDLSPTNRVQIDDYKPEGVPKRLQAGNPTVQFVDPFLDKNKKELEELDGTDHSSTAKEIVGAINSRSGATREEAGRPAGDNAGGRETVVVRKRPAANEGRAVDSLSRSGRESDSHGGAAEETRRCQPQAQEGGAEVPVYLSKARLGKPTTPKT